MAQLHALPTVGEIARRFDASVHRIEYAIRSRAIQPSGWAGNARVFDDAAMAEISAALGIGSTPRERPLSPGAIARGAVEVSRG